MVEEQEFLIIGAGMSGLSAAKELSLAGYSVLVLEKGRGSGGRLSSKRIRFDDSEFTFDIGCPSFEANQTAFQSALQAWSADGVVTELPAQANQAGSEKSQKYVGATRNSALTRAMCRDIDVKFATRVKTFTPEEDGWKVKVDAGDGEQSVHHVKNVIISAPPRQAFDLLPQEHVFRGLVEPYQMDPQWVISLVVSSDEGLLFDESKSAHIACISNERTKRQMTASDAAMPVDHSAWQIQMTPEWTVDHLESDKQLILDKAVECLKECRVQPDGKEGSNFDADGADFQVKASHVHRWLYARPVRSKVPNADGYLWSKKDGLGICGDYLAARDGLTDLEAAFESGQKLARAAIDKC